MEQAPLLALLCRFLDENWRNEWLNSPELKVYVRRGLHAIDGKIENCLDVANATSDVQSGAYVQFILGLPALLRQSESYPKVIFIENVGYPGLDAMFTRFGYTAIPSDGLGPNFYKRV